ncbi:hypothetical protein J6590_099407 [Homalodisca vitripennis]|nr:hypothetical protein J6590_099407 [Homalodisca vitripennis]
MGIETWYKVFGRKLRMPGPQGQRAKPQTICCTSLPLTEAMTSGFLLDDLVKNNTFGHRGSAADLASATMTVMSSSCDQSMPGVSRRRGKNSVY